MLATAHGLRRKTVIEVVGHTDGVGAEKDNEALAQARAETVISRLIEAGVSTDVLIPKSAGSAQPLRRGNSETDLLFNRYVSFHVVASHQ